GSDEHGDIGIDDGGESPLEPGVERGNDRATYMRFLSDAFVDQDIGIDRHANGEEHTRDARQGERRPEKHEGGKNERDMDCQRDIGEDAEYAIGDQHIEGDEGGADIGRALARVDRILTETRTDGAFLDNRELGWQRAGAQKNREIVRPFDREMPGDLAGTARDGTK